MIISRAEILDKGDHSFGNSKQMANETMDQMMASTFPTANEKTWGPMIGFKAVPCDARAISSEFRIHTPAIALVIGPEAK